MKVISTEKFNSNNAWGFGGGIGVETRYDNDLFNRKGKAYYRHLPPSKFNEWYVQVDAEFSIRLDREPKIGDVVLIFADRPDGHHKTVVAKADRVTDEKLKVTEKSGYKLVKTITIS